jgi:magnesium transporter
MTIAPQSVAFRDEEGALNQSFIETVSRLLKFADGLSLRGLLSEAHSADMGDLLESLEPLERKNLILLLGDSFDFTALTELDEGMRLEILENMPADQLAEGLTDLETDDAIYILEDLDAEDKARVLERLPAPERITLERSLTYPEGSAARLMKSDLIAVPPYWSVGECIDFMRDSHDLPDNFTEIFVVDPGYHLTGILRLDRLLRTKRPVIITDILEKASHIVKVDDEQTDVARLFERYNLISAPVIDEHGRLAGVLTIDDILDVLSEETESDIKQMGGIQADEELSDRIKSVFPARFTWLFVNLCTAFLASFVVSRFEGAIKQMVALAVLMPIVASMGGNAGTQTMTVIVRALATREMTKQNAWRIIRRELGVGLLNGLMFGIIIAIAGYVWFPETGIWPVIATAVALTLTAAAIGGLVIPLTLEKFNIDPAIASGPLVTTITDVVGFLTFLGLATLWLAT